MTAALARNTAAARLPETRADAASTPETAPETKSKTKATTKPGGGEASALAVDSAREGRRNLAKAKVPGSVGGVKEEAKARPGAGADEIKPDKPLSKRDRQVTKLADRADRLFAQLVKQRDIIRDAVEFGDTGAAAKAYGRARDLFRQIIAIGNEAQLNMSSSSDSAALIDAKERISHRVRYAYEWAALIDEAMPGDQHL